MRRSPGEPCGEHIPPKEGGSPNGTTYCSRLTPCPLHDPNVAVLARDVYGHVVPQLVMARAVGNLGNKVSFVGSAVVVCPENPRENGAEYQMVDYMTVQMGSVPQFSFPPRAWLILPLLVVRDDRWDEVWIELVDGQGYIAMISSRHRMGCEINGHWYGEEDERGIRRCMKCGAPMFDSAYNRSAALDLARQLCTCDRDGSLVLAPERMAARPRTGRASSIATSSRRT